MNSDDHAAALFDRLRVRSLVIWLALGAVLVIAAYSLFEIDFDDPFWELCLIAFITLWPLLWLQLKLKSSRVSFRLFISPLPEQRRWFRWILVTMGLAAFSIGCMFLVWYPLSFACPRLVESLILSDTLFSFDKGTPKPIPYIVIDFALVIIVAPFSEELLFRGVLLRRLAVKWGMRKSIVLTSLIFGVLHFDLIGSVFFGFVMAVLYIRTRTLVVPIFCHALNNATVYLLAGIEESMTDIAEPTIDQFRSDVWIGLICLLVATPWVISFCVKNWPREDCPIPYSTGP